MTFVGYKLFLPPDGLSYGIFFDPEDGGCMFIRNAGKLSTNYTALYSKKIFQEIRAIKINVSVITKVGNVALSVAILG
jgi:hypothetical protein